MHSFTGWRRWGLVVAALLFSTPTVHAGDDAATDEPDFPIQGEYVGELALPTGNEAVGVQVVAQGAAKFRAVTFRGGLPGDGWDQSDSRACDGESRNGTLTCQDGDRTLVVDGDHLTITAGDKPIGRLAKVLRRSPTMGAKPPDGTVILFDGTSADAFEKGRLTNDRLLMQGATSKARFGSGTLHIEFRLPFEPQGQRGNSGCYLQSRYEVQMLNSMGLTPHEHECGGIPSVKAADINMCYPPLSWQTYDIDFTAAKYSDGSKVQPARMTVRHNGVLVHDNVEVPHATTSAPLAEGPEPGPIDLQDHLSEVRYRNIWFLESAAKAGRLP